jgi:hypothetical protein
MFKTRPRHPYTWWSYASLCWCHAHVACGPGRLGHFFVLARLWYKPKKAYGEYPGPSLARPSGLQIMHESFTLGPAIRSIDQAWAFRTRPDLPARPNLNLNHTFCMPEPSPIWCPCYKFRTKLRLTWSCHLGQAAHAVIPRPALLQLTAAGSEGCVAPRSRRPGRPIAPPHMLRNGRLLNGQHLWGYKFLWDIIEIENGPEAICKSARWPIQEMTYFWITIYIVLFFTTITIMKFIQEITYFLLTKNIFLRIFLTIHP